MRPAAAAPASGRTTRTGRHPSDGPARSGCRRPSSFRRWDSGGALRDSDQRRGETQANRLHDWINAVGHPPALQRLNGTVESAECRQVVGQDDDLTAPAASMLDVAAVDTQHQLRPRVDGGADFLRIEAVDREAVTLGTE